jgi:hypothetical protein
MSLKAGASVVALIAVIGFSPQAMSQTSPAPPAAKPNAEVKKEAPKAPVTGQIVVQEENTILARDLIGQTVSDPEKAKIGTISDLILSKDGKSVEGFVIGVGGFLGIGEKAVALKMDRLKMMPEKDASLQLTMDIKKEELTNTPTFKSKKEQESEKQAERARSQPPAQPGSPPSQPKTN